MTSRWARPFAAVRHRAAATLRPCAVIAMAWFATIAGIASAADEGKADAAGAPAAQSSAASPAARDARETLAKDASAAKPARFIDRAEGRLIVFNRHVFTFRSSVFGASARERVDPAWRRIVATLERGGPGTVTVEQTSVGSAISIDGSLAFIVTNDDVDTEAGETLDTTTEAAVHALEQAIAATKEARDARLFGNAVIWAGGATAIYLAILWILRLVGRAVTRRMLQLTETTAGQLRVGGAEILRRDRVVRVVGFFLRVGFWALVLLVSYEWLSFVLGRFPFTRPWGESLNGFLLDTTFDILSAVARAVPDLLVVVVIVVIARTVNGMLAGFFESVQRRRIHVTWLDADSARPTRRLATIGVWIFALVMAYPYIPGSESEAFKGLSVLIGLMISIGGSGLVGQAASGLILMYTRTYRPGEYVRIADQEGTIVEMGMFTTRLRTGLGEELTLPNSLVLGAVTKNYSRVVQGEGFVLDSAVTIGYDAPWRQVHAMLIEAAHRTEGVLAVPAPRVYQTVLSDFYVEYRLVCQAIQSEPRPRAEVLSSLHANIQDVFNEHGVQIMSPHYLGDPAAAKVVPKGQWYAPPAAPPT